LVNEPYISIGLAFITSLTWGINAHILKKGVAEENPFLGVAIRSIFAFPILFLITFLWRGIEGFTGYANQEVLFFTILGSTLFATGDILYLVGLKKYPVNMLVPIVATYPIIAIFILIITGSEEVSPTVIFGTVIVIFGIGLVTNGDIAGILNYKILSLGVLNALFYGFSVYYIKIALSFDTTDAISVSGIRTLILGLIGLIVFHSSSKNRDVRRQRSKESKMRSFKFLAVSGIIGWVIGATAFFIAVERIGAAIPTPISSTYPIVATIIGLFLRIEEVSKKQFVGIIFSVLGTVIIIT